MKKTPSTHKHPKHLHRGRLNGFSAKSRLGMAVKSYERQNDPVPLTLPTPPWGKPNPKAEGS